MSEKLSDLIEQALVNESRAYDIVGRSVATASKICRVAEIQGRVFTYPAYDENRRQWRIGMKQIAKSLRNEGF